MLLEKVFAILKSKNEKQASDPQEIVTKKRNEDGSDDLQEKYSSTFESNSESGDKADKANTSEPQRSSYSSHFESETDESKPDDAAQGEMPESGETDQGIPKSADTNEIIGSKILNSSNEMSELDVPDDDPASSESQKSENIPQTSVPVPEPHPLAGEPDWNVLSTIEEVTTVADTMTDPGDLSGQEDTSHSSYSKTDDTFKQTHYHSEDMSEEGIQSLSVDNRILNSSSNQDESRVHDIVEDFTNTQSRIDEIESKKSPLGSPVFSLSTNQNDADSLASIHSLDVSSNISDSEKNNNESNEFKAESSSLLKEEESNLGNESLKASQNIEKDTTDIIENIIEEVVRISELATESDRSITPSEFVALSVHETDDESLIEDPVSVEQKTHPDHSEELQPDAPSVTVDDTTEAVRLSEGEVLLTGLISEGELTASEGGSLVTQSSVPGLSAGHLGDCSDSEPGEADPRLVAGAGQHRRRLPVSLDTSSSSSWSEGEWRASPARMRRFLNMASAFRMINKSDQD